MAVAGLIALQPALTAHEVPNEVTVVGFVRPEGQSLRLLLRAPLKSFRDIEIPMLQNQFLDFSRIDRALNDAATIWLRDYIEVYENGRRLGTPTVLAVRVSLPADRSFVAYDTALANLMTGPRLGQETQIYWEQGMLDIGYEYPITSDQSDFAIRPGLTRLGLQVNVVLRFQQPGNTERAFDIHADTGIVHLDPRWHQAFYLFARDGFFHILDGTDHLLFLFCLVIPFRRFRALVLIVTAFTIAHSMTLIAAASGLVPDALWFSPLVETIIAASILYMALENIAGSTNVQRRWTMAFAFGLVHGFGFSFALRETLQLAGSHLLTSLLAFNVGVEAGQLFVLALLVPALHVVFRYVVRERVGAIILSALVAHTAWHWTAERWEQLRQFDWPALGRPAAVDVLPWLMLAVGAAAAAWLIAVLTRFRAVNYPPNSGPGHENQESA